MAEWKEIARDLSGFVAKFLTDKTGDTWMVDQGTELDWSVWLVRKDADGNETGRLFVRKSQKDGDRVVFSGTYPSNTVYPGPAHVEITCDRFKDADKIAGDIVRRMLPKYDPEMVRVAEGNALDVAQFNARKAAYAELGNVVPLKLAGHGHTVRDTRWVADYRKTRAEGHDLRAEITCDVWGKRYDVDLEELTIEQVRAILTLLNEGEE